MCPAGRLVIAVVPPHLPGVEGCPPQEAVLDEEGVGLGHLRGNRSHCAV